MLLNSVGFNAKIMHGGKQPIFRQRQIYCIVQTVK